MRDLIADIIPELPFHQRGHARAGLTVKTLGWVPKRGDLVWVLLDGPNKTELTRAKILEDTSTLGDDLMLVEHFNRAKELVELESVIPYAPLKAPNDSTQGGEDEVAGQVLQLPED